MKTAIQLVLFTAISILTNLTFRHFDHGQGVIVDPQSLIQYNRAGKLESIPGFYWWKSFLVFNSQTAQVRFDLTGNDNYQNVPFRVNTSTDVSANFVTDGSAAGASFIAVSMDKDTLGINRIGDPDYTGYLGWNGVDTFRIYADRKITGHDNHCVTIDVGGAVAGHGDSNPVRISGAYTLPLTDGNPDQVLATDGHGNLRWVSIDPKSETWTVMNNQWMEINGTNYEVEVSISANNVLTYRIGKPASPQGYKLPAELERVFSKPTAHGNPTEH